MGPTNPQADSSVKVGLNKGNDGFPAKEDLHTSLWRKKLETLTTSFATLLNTARDTKSGNGSVFVLIRQRTGRKEIALDWAEIEILPLDGINH